MSKREAAEATLYKESQLPQDFPRADIERRRLMGDQAMISLVTLQDGCVVEPHSHPNEQFSVILEGSIRFTTGEPGNEKIFLAKVGDFVHLPSGVVHGAVAEQRCKILDVFSPPAEETGIDA